MSIHTLAVPFRYAQLILRHTHNLLTEAEADELDAWIVESDENGEVFETLPRTWTTAFSAPNR